MSDAFVYDDDYFLVVDDPRLGTSPARRVPVPNVVDRFSQHFPTRESLGGFVSLADPKYDIRTEYANNYSEIMRAIADVPTGGTLFVPDGAWKYTTTPVIDRPISIVGESQYQSLLFAIGCSGLTVAPGVSSFSLKNLEVASGPRYTTTPHAFKGVVLQGSTGSRPSSHVYEDVYIDGFETGIDASWLWSSAFRNVRTAYGLVGLWAKGLGVNNFVSQSHFSGNGGSGSRGVIVGDGTTPTEGWVIGDCLTYDNEIGIEGVAAAHCKIHDCILDYNHNSGVVIRAGVTNFGGNWDIHGNFVAVYGAGGDAGIGLNNTINNIQDRGCRVSNNYIQAYPGSTCQRGIKATASHSKRHTIIGNTIYNMTAADIDAALDADITIGWNKCLSAISPNIYGGTQVGGNTGVQHYARASQRFSIGANTHTYDQAVPTTGTWARGDVCWNITASAAGTPGWVCTVAGTPGTWKAMANLAS